MLASEGRTPQHKLFSQGEMSAVGGGKMSHGRLGKDGRWIPEVSGTWEIEDRPDRWGPITAKREGLCNHCDEDQKVAHLPVGRTLTVNLCARCLKEALDLLEALDV